MSETRNFTGTASRSDSSSQSPDQGGAQPSAPSQSQGNFPTVLLIRHGETDLNKSNRVRGWADVDVSEKGRADTLRTASALSNLPVSEVVSSDLTRAEQTAEVLGNQWFAPVESNRGLRDWNYGEYTGMKLSDVKDDLEGHVKAPNSKVPGGESFGEFENRWRSGFQDLVQRAMSSPSGVVAGVTHSRNIATLEAWLSGKKDPKALIQASSVPPSGVMALSIQNGRIVQIPYDNGHLQKDI